MTKNLKQVLADHREVVVVVDNSPGALKRREKTDVVEYVRKCECEAATFAWSPPEMVEEMHLEHQVQMIEQWMEAQG